MRRKEYIEHKRFIEQVKRDEAAQRKKNARDAFFILLFIIVMIVLFTGAGIPVHWGPPAMW